MNARGLQIFQELFRNIDPAEISDIQFRAGKPVYLHTKKGLIAFPGLPALNAEVICDVASVLYDLQEKSEGFAQNELGDEVVTALKANRTLDFSTDGVPLGDGRITGRMRVQCHLSMTGPGVTCRILSDDIPPLDVLGLSPDTVFAMKEFAKRRQGFALVTGQTGSGKSTTLAALLNWLRMNHPRHIVTIEDPIEYRYEACNAEGGPSLGLMTQQEVEKHIPSYQKGLKDALRKAPHVVLIGEIRDRETMETAIEAAQTGHIVLSTLHTNGAVKTMGRILDFFPHEQHQSILSSLSEILLFILSQGLIPTENGKALNYEFLQNNSPAVRAGIAAYDGGEKSLEDAILHTGNIAWDKNLDRLKREGIITYEQFMMNRMNDEDDDSLLHFESA